LVSLTLDKALFSSNFNIAIRFSSANKALSACLRLCSASYTPVPVVITDPLVGEEFDNVAQGDLGGEVELSIFVHKLNLVETL
jgi:hypothetical protein